MIFQKRFLPWGLFLFPLVWAAAAFAAETPEPPVQVHGDTVEYYDAEQKVIGTGHVSIDHGGARLTADKITFYLATKNAVAEGRVTLIQRGSVFKGDRGEYNFEKKSGNVSRMDGETPPYYTKARAVEKISDTHYRATDGSITTCCGDSPFYKVQAHHIDVYPDDKVVVHNAVLYVKNVPILFVPYYEQRAADVGRFPVQIVPGKNQEWGFFVLSKWRYYLSDTPAFHSKGNVLLDYRQKRGFGWGAENFYHGEKIGHGALRGYSIDDRAVSPGGINPNRYRAQWRHQAPLTPSTTLTTEVNKLSDATVVKDFFFREEYERNAFPDNYVSLVTARPEYTLTILDRERLDDFFTVVERSPEVRLDTHNREFEDMPFYLREEYQFSNLRKEFADTDVGLSATRFDTNHTLTYAGHAGAVSIDPRVGTRQTFYSHDADSGRDFVRGTFDPGLDVSTRFYRTYDVYVKALGLDYNQIRHVFTPTASYNYRPTPTVPRTLLQRFDGIDDLDKQNFIRFAFENKFQTKEHAKGEVLTPREIARVIPFFDTDLHTGHLENTGIDVELRPYTWMGIEADTTYNSHTRDWETFNTDFYLERGPAKIALGERYVQNESSQTTAQVNWNVRPDLQVKVYERYEFEDNKSKEFELALSKAFECVIVDFTYNHRAGSGDTFYFVFRLKAFPRAPIGLSQSYNRPKAATAVPRRALF
ncbi:MAG: LPS-assembly protein LptD [Candidatus Omnitrophica bacterium]|nr:LPS-assembly protein LptD [Candidatus Omnitrophota bacterium]